MNPVYDVDYFINKFSKIPEKRWTTGVYRKDNARCGVGHCQPNEKEETALRELFKSFSKYRSDIVVIAVNDADVFSGPPNFGTTIDNMDISKEARFLGTTPKQRILAALELIKAGVSV